MITNIMYNVCNIEAALHYRHSCNVTLEVCRVNITCFSVAVLFLCCHGDVLRVVMVTCLLFS